MRSPAVIAFGAVVAVVSTMVNIPFVFGCCAWLSRPDDHSVALGAALAGVAGALSFLGLVTTWWTCSASEMRTKKLVVGLVASAYVIVTAVVDTYMFVSPRSFDP